MDEIGDFFDKFFYTDSFPPRWYCGKWSEFHGWLYIISDLAIWAAYFTIPFLLIHFIRKKKDVPFPKIFWLFGAFILACGLTHLIDAIIFWLPIYRISAFVRLITAIASCATIYALYKVLPNAFSLKTPAELERQVHERTEELRLSVERMQFMADAMPQIVWTARPDGYRDYYNVRALHYTGRTPEDLYGWKWTEIIHPDDREISLKKWKEALNNGTGFEVENRQLNAVGEYKWHLTRALPQTDETGNILMWLGTATNIEQQKQEAAILESKVAERTEQLKRVNAELKQSNSDLDQFASVASHDLQAPLRTITTYLSMLRDSSKDELNERSIGFIDKSINTSLRMKNLIENLLSYSRINTTKPEMKLIDLNRVVEAAIANIESLKESKNAEIQYDSLPEIYADQIQMIQLIQNLVANGINYNTKEKILIKISATVGQENYTVSVGDNGNGIEGKYLTQVFEVFARLDSEVTGSGLGLSISKRIIDKHNGSIWAESVVGEGTTFYFTIPNKRHM